MIDLKMKKKDLFYFDKCLILTLLIVFFFLLDVIRKKLITY